MLTQLCAELRNYFCKPEDVHYGEFSITEQWGIEPCPFLKAGQYFRIRGSVFNDGVHQFGGDDLIPEVFPGEVWAMAVPPAVIALDAEIDAWVEANQTALNSPYQSESFGGYSYVKAGAGYGNSGNASSALTWQDHFRRRLAPWKKVCVL